MLLEVTHVLLVGFAMVLMSQTFSRTCSEIRWWLGDFTSLDEIATEGDEVCSFLSSLFL